MTQPARVECEVRGDVALATIAGEFDVANSDDLRREIQTNCAECTGLVLDLTDTVYMDSAAIRTVFSVAKFFQSRGGTVVAVVPDAGLIRKVVSVSGMDAVMPVVETTDEALRLAGGPDV